MQDILLEMRGITKRFPGVKALDNVNFAVRRGEIHCLVGENDGIIFKRPNHSSIPPVIFPSSIRMMRSARRAISSL